MNHPLHKSINGMHDDPHILLALVGKALVKPLHLRLTHDEIHSLGSLVQG